MNFQSILVISCLNSSFIKTDESILKEEYEVKVYRMQLNKGIGIIFPLVKQFMWLLFNQRKYGIVYIWFSDYHSLIPIFLSKIFLNKVLLIAGGYDADEILVGIGCTVKDRFRKWVCQYCFKHADRILAVSACIQKILNEHQLGKNTGLVHSCVNTDLFPGRFNNKESLVITVGGQGNLKETLRKKLDLFIEIGNEFSYKFPELNVQFEIIGHDPCSASYNFLKSMIKSKNVHIVPRLKLRDLIKKYEQASIYMQLSTHEGFGLAQAEAMYHGCIPVSHDGGAIREVVGTSGFVFNTHIKKQYIDVLRDIFSGKYESYREGAQKRIQSEFSKEKRKNQLVGFIDEMISPQRMGVDYNLT